MKPLYPTLKEKKRYILLKVYSDFKISFQDIEKEVLAQINNFLGNLEASKAGIIIFKETWDSKSKTFILRVGNKQVDKVKSAITLIKDVKNKPVMIASLKTSGTLRKLKDFQKKVK